MRIRSATSRAEHGKIGTCDPHLTCKGKQQLGGHCQRRAQVREGCPCGRKGVSERHCGRQMLRPKRSVCLLYQTSCIRSAPISPTAPFADTGNSKGEVTMRCKLAVHPFTVTIVVPLLLAALVLAPRVAQAQKGNPACPGEEVFFNPGNGEDIVVPEGYRVEVFARDLNFPTGIAFQGGKERFRVLVIQSGTGLPGRCNNNEAPVFEGKFSPVNPFTPDVMILDDRGQGLARGLFKPTPNERGFQPDGPAIDLAFERGFRGGTLFASDSNQGARGAPGVG